MRSTVANPDRSLGRHRGRLRVVAGAALVIGSVVGSLATSIGVAGADSSSTVNITITPQGCAPKPASVPTGAIDVNVANKNAGSVSETELRTQDLSHILGEQENLTPGLSGGFSVNLAPGKYVFSCPNASKSHWTFTVTGKQKGKSWQSVPALKTAVAGYSTYINQNVAQLVTASQSLCSPISSGSITAAKLGYPKARLYYERIEPVAEIWGALDTNIDGRWENPVTVLSKFVGFHRIEQLLWEDNTLKGTSTLCSGLVKNEQQLATLVHSATYNPLEMAAGATDLVDEASTAKVTGEEERYSNTDLPVLQANIDGANEVVTLLAPYLKKNDASLLTTLQGAYAKATKVVSSFKATPGYDGTGYVEYSTVLNQGRRQLSQAINAYAEDLSKLSSKVSA